MTERMVSKRLASLLDLHDLLLDMVQRVRQVVPFDSGGVWLFDPVSQTLSPQIYLGENLSTPVPVPLGVGIVGQVAAQQIPQRIDDLDQHPDRLYTDPDARAELAVPVVAEGDLFGVLNVESHHTYAYTREHRITLQVLADQTAQLVSTLHMYQDLETSHDRLLAEQRTRQRETEALLRLATITSGTLNMDEMLANALRETAELLNCEGAQLLIPNYASYQLAVHEPSQYGLAQSWPPESWPLDGPGYLVEVFHTGQQVAHQVAPPEAGRGCDNVLACPLNTRSRTLGVLNLINQRSGAFNDEQLDIAQTIANQIAVSMASAQSFAAERRRADMMNRINRVSQAIYATLDTPTLLRNTAQSIFDVFGHDAVYILLRAEENGADGALQVRASVASDAALHAGHEAVLAAGQGVTGRALRSGETQLVQDVRTDPDYFALDAQRRLQSCLVVPLRQGEDTIGTINLLSAQINAFSELEQNALETLANQLSIALENARHYAQAQRRLLEQSIVHQIGQDLTAILDYQALMQAVVQHMNRALSTSGCLVGLCQLDDDAVRVAADYRAPHHPNAGEPLMRGDLLALDTHHAITQAIRTRAPVTVYRGDPAARRLLEQLGDHSQLILPMVTGERVLGVVDWTDVQPGRRFTTNDIQLAQTLVAQATIAIDNALLFRELENRARELAKANRLKNQFLATISHELRTPMNSIIGFSDMLLSGLYGDLNDRQASRLETIQRNGYHLLALIDDLLDLSKIDAGRMALYFEYTDLHTVCEAVAQGMDAQARERGLTMTLDIPDGLPPVWADPQRLDQIITNLLSNAIKFTHEGHITITSRRTNENDRAYVETTVADTGIGLSQDDRAIIFDEFRQADGSSTRSYGGTGLGLAITRRLVQMMHGAIWVESEAGVGSRFTFILPVQPPAGE